MITQTKQQQLKEIEFQTKMLNNLKKWIRNLIIISSVGAVLGYWGVGMQNGLASHIVGVVGIIIAAVSVVICVIVGLAFRNGKKNLDKILSIVGS